MIDLRTRWTGGETGWRSAADLARDVLDAWRKAGDTLESELPNERNLANQINKLARGERQWFRSHSGALNALADLLELTPEDLGFGTADPGRPGLHVFNELPAARPFDPQHEEPLELASLHAVGRWTMRADQTLLQWFTPEPYRGLQRPSWVVMPPGSGRHFVASWYRSRSAARVLAVNEIREVPLGDHDGTRLVILVERPTSALDAQHVRRLSGREDTLVLSPFEPFSGADMHDLTSFDAWELRTGQRRLFGRGNDWDVYRWEGAPGWRRSLASWIHKRLPDDTRVLPAAFLEWLDVADSEERLFTTPGDLLTILARVHEEGLGSIRKEFTSGGRPSRILQAELSATYREATARDVWLQTRGVAAFEALAARHVSELALPLRSGASLAQWAAILEPALAPSSASDDEVIAMVGRLASEPSKAKRTAAASTLQRRVQTRLLPDEAISYLVSAGILQRASLDRYVLAPRWLAQHLAAARVQALLASSPAEWGNLVVDPDRRDVVERALARLPEASLREVVARALDAYDPTVLGSISTIETLFHVLAVGERIGSLDLKQQHDLFEAASRTMTARYSDTPPAPLTRRGVLEDAAAGASFLADCWTWSRYVPADPGGLPEPLAWLLPGLTRPRVSTAPAWLAAQPLVRTEERSISDTVQVLTAEGQRLMDVVWSLAASFEWDEATEDYPTALFPVALAKCFDGDTFDSRTVRLLVSEPWARTYARKALLSDANSPARAARLFRACLRDKDLLGAVLKSPHGDEDRDLGRAMLEHLRIEDFTAAIPQHLDAFGGALVALPPRLRSALASSILAHAPHRIDELYVRHAAGLASEDVPALITVVVNAHQGAAAAHVWRLQAATAREQTFRAVDERRLDDIRAWLQYAPLDESLLAKLEGLPTTERPGWMSWWLRARLPAAGALSHRVFALVRGAV